MESDPEPGDQKAETFIQATRRRQILDGAIETLAESGYAGASLARIAQRLGISKGVISYHFATKDALMIKVVDHGYAGMIEAVVPKIMAEKSVVDAIRVHLTELARYAKEHRSTLLALGEVMGHLRRPDGRLQFGAEGNEALYPGIERLYRSGQESGELRDFDVRVMAITQQAAIDAMFAYWGNHPEHDLTQHAEHLADLIIHATRSTTARRSATKRSTTKRSTTSRPSTARSKRTEK